MLFNNSCAYKHCPVSTNTQILEVLSSHLPNSVTAALRKSPLPVGRCDRCHVPPQSKPSNVPGGGTRSCSWRQFEEQVIALMWCVLSPSRPASWLSFHSSTWALGLAMTWALLELDPDVGLVGLPEFSISLRPPLTAVSVHWGLTLVLRTR